MIKARNFLIQKIFFPTGDLLFGSTFTKQRRRYKGYDKLSAELLEELQSKKLKALMNFACSKCKYYSDLNLDLTQSLPTLLKQFPILTKEIVRANTEQ